MLCWYITISDLVDLHQRIAKWEQALVFAWSNATYNNVVRLRCTTSKDELAGICTQGEKGVL